MNNVNLFTRTYPERYPYGMSINVMDSTYLVLILYHYKCTGQRLSAGSVLSVKLSLITYGYQSAHVNKLTLFTHLVRHMFW